MLPQALKASTGVASVGCIGNRVYTGLDDGEMYMTVPGAKLAGLLENLGATLNANAELEKFHRQRAAALERIAGSGLRTPGPGLRPEARLRPA